MDSLPSNLALKFSPPAEDQTAFLFPHPKHWRRLWENNLSLIQGQHLTVWEGHGLSDLRCRARGELLQLARKHVSQYATVEYNLDPERIIMTGHQPELFHPGVWFKNFLASELASQYQATGVNLIIDNDVCEDLQIQFLEPQGSIFELSQLAIDAPSAAVPFEERVIIDIEFVRQFCGRLKRLVPSSSPLLGESLWSHVRRLMKQQIKPWKLGYLLAAARHCLELEHGSKTLEIPLSLMADTDSFRHFCWHVICRAKAFRRVHNRVLSEFRKVNKLRSRSRPVPDLEIVDDWTETSFWVWNSADPVRRPLFAKKIGSGVCLTDRHNWRCELTEASYLDQLRHQREKLGIKIRPRALMTTTYARMFLSDLFIHGTGGGRYDLLSNQIAVDFFQVPLPDFGVATATFKRYADLSKTLIENQTSFSPAAANLRENLGVDLNSDAVIKQLFRQLESQPDRILVACTGNNSASQLPTKVRQLIQTKSNWVREVQVGTKAQRHQAITECNAQLQPWVQPLKTELENLLSLLASAEIQRQQVEDRGYSFILFPVGLIDSLKKLVTQTR